MSRARVASHSVSHKLIDLSEGFYLATGTWVHKGPLNSRGSIDYKASDITFEGSGLKTNKQPKKPIEELKLFSIVFREIIHFITFLPYRSTSVISLGGDRDGTNLHIYSSVHTEEGSVPSIRKHYTGLFVIVAAHTGFLEISVYSRAWSKHS